MRSTKPQFCASKDDICDIAEVLNKLESPSHQPTSLAFVISIQSQDLFAQVALPLEGRDVEGLSVEDYELKDVMLGRPTQDSTQKMMTMGVKEVLKHMEQDEIKL